MFSAEDEVRENARRMILPGFMPLDEVHSIVAELAEDEDSPPAAERIRAIVDQLWSERLAEQSTWHDLSMPTGWMLPSLSWKPPDWSRGRLSPVAAAVGWRR